MHRSAFTLLLIIGITLVFNTARAEETSFDIEPNNTRENAVPVQEYTIAGTIAGGSDSADWYVLESEIGDVTTFSLIYNAGQYDIDLNIYSDDEMVGRLITPQSPDEDTFEVTGRCFLEVYPYENSEGTYEILINGGLGPPMTDEERQELCGGPSEIEPNDIRMQATELETELSIDGLLCDGDIDWFVTYGQEGVNPKVTIEYDDSACDIDAVIYSDYTVANTLSSLTSPDSENLTVPGVCWIKVFSWNGSGAYTLTIEPQDPDYVGFFDDVEWIESSDGNSSRESAEMLAPYEREIDEFVLGITGELYDVGEDWYRIESDSFSEGSYHVALDYDSVKTDIDVEIFKGDEIKSSCVIQGPESPDSAICELNSDYYIRVMAMGSSGEYRLLIQPESSVSVQGISPGMNVDLCQGHNELEPNDEKDLADLITGLEIQGYACEDDVDWYVLDGQEGTGPWFELYYNTPTDIDMEIWDDDERVGTLQGSGSPDTGRYEVNGKCYLKVWAHDGEGDYRISIIPDTAPPDPSEVTT